MKNECRSEHVARWLSRNYLPIMTGYIQVEEREKTRKELASPWSFYGD